jgi:hypothetical protein
MSSRKLQNYPAEFAIAFRRAHQGEEIAIPCDSVTEARRVRTRLYAFKQAILDNPTHDVYATLAMGDVSISIRKTSVIISRRQGV